jgi:hypothetical protein
MKTKSYALLIMVFLAACSNSDVSIGTNEAVQHDDFFYTVTHVEKAERIGDIKPKGQFYLVHFQVNNAAKRVNYPWDNNVAFVEDEHGNVYENSLDAQKILNKQQSFGWKQHYLTAFGSSQNTIFVFDVPASAQPSLRYRGDFLMGDLFDGNRFSKTKVRLF